VRGTAMWGNALAASALAVAVLGPLMGALVDAGGRRKPLLAACSGVTIAGALMLWFAAPDASNVLWVLVCVAVANAAFELGMVFYNAMLPGLASAGRVGRLSGWGWALGYAGGIACLVVALVVFVEPEAPPFGLDPENAEHVRVVAPLAALWFVVFVWPMFAFTPDRPTVQLGLAARLGTGLANLINLLNPDMIVISGGVTRAGEHLLEPLRAEVRRRAFRKGFETCEIVVSELGGMAGVVGAAATFRVERCGGLG